MVLKSLTRFRDAGLLFLRAGIGIMFILHGWPKLIGGPERWEKLGNAMTHLGIDFFPPGWGLAAALAEVLGGALFMAGAFFRPASFALFFTMVVAATMHIQQGDGFLKASHAIEAGILFFSLLFIGPGKYSFDKG